MQVEAVHFNGGFGRADKLVPADILAPPLDAAALIDAEDALLAEINAAEGLAAQLAGRREAGRRVWRAVGLDPEGLDLSAGGAAARVDYAAPAFEANRMAATAGRRRGGVAGLSLSPPTSGGSPPPPATRRR